MRKKYNHSEAEQRFYDYISKEYPGFKITKRGFPDFMIIKNQSVVGFIEVKRDNLNDELTEEQRMFKDFCKKNRIPYQVWSPMMSTEYWKNRASKFFKQRMMYSQNSIFEQLNSKNKRTLIIKNDAKKDFYLVHELANKLRVNIITIYRYIKAKKLKAYKIGKEFRIDKKEFNKFLDKVKIK